tara:strand:+ start:3128 stop:3769 length:642 start_codon:yes stop_codon:yes gene_type:complete
MKPILRQYKHGGWHPFKKEEGPKPVLKMSEREPSYGTVSQQLGDAVQYSGGDNSDILKMLALTKEKPVTSWADVNFSSEEILPQFRAARDGDSDNINFFKIDPESQQYARAKMSDGDLSEMFGRDLSVSEEKYVRGQVFKNPALLSYFMGIGEEPSKREMKKFNVVKNVGKKSQNIGKGTTGGGQVGEGNRITEFIRDGVAYICLDGTCKVKQ